jgi:aryl-alcohol dehydrogenase-like predicted oxidoreductase
VSEAGLLIRLSALLRTRSYVNQQGLSRKHIIASVDKSLERLGLDYIDVLQCHRFDPDTPIAETMQALHDVVQSGKVRYLGSEYRATPRPTHEMARALVVLILFW